MSHALCVQHEVFGYGGSNGETTIPPHLMGNTRICGWSALDENVISFLLITNGKITHKYTSKLKVTSFNTTKLTRCVREPSVADQIEGIYP